MKTAKVLTIGAVILGILFFVVSYIYGTDQANQLPSFFPGHDAGSIVIHSKHAIGTFILGLACLIFAWFQGAPKKSTEDQEVKGE